MVEVQRQGAEKLGYGEGAVAFEEGRDCGIDGGRHVCGGLTAVAGNGPGVGGRRI